MIASAKRLAGSFDEVGAATAAIDMSGLVDNNWGEQNDAAAGMLALGHRVYWDRYEAMLTGTTGLSLEEEEDDTFKEIYKPIEGDSSMPWGKIMKKQEKSSKKLYKSLCMGVH